MENKSKETFRYSYSAKQKEEIEAIRRKYQPEAEDKMEQLRRLDESATRKGTVVGLVLGILGSLVFGTGMSCIMVFDVIWFVPGIVIGVVGMLLMALAYPMYNRIIKKERERIAPEILRLSDELLEQNK